MKCEYCKYKWEAKVKRPKQCPYCKRYIKNEGINRGVERVKLLNKEDKGKSGKNRGNPKL